MRRCTAGTWQRRTGGHSPEVDEAVSPMVAQRHGLLPGPGAQLLERLVGAAGGQLLQRPRGRGHPGPTPSLRSPPTRSRPSRMNPRLCACPQPAPPDATTARAPSTSREAAVPDADAVVSRVWPPAARCPRSVGAPRTCRAQRHDHECAARSLRGWHAPGPWHRRWTRRLRRRRAGGARGDALLVDIHLGHLLVVHGVAVPVRAGDAPHR